MGLPYVLISSEPWHVSRCRRTSRPLSKHFQGPKGSSRPRALQSSIKSSLVGCNPRRGDGCHVGKTQHPLHGQLWQSLTPSPDDPLHLLPLGSKRCFRQCMSLLAAGPISDMSQPCSPCWTCLTAPASGWHPGIGGAGKMQWHCFPARSSKWGERGIRF